MIIDNYLFHGKNYERRQNSLYEILKNIVPKNLKIPFHLTIFIENNKNELSKEKMEKVVEEIHNMHLCSDLKVSIIAHTEKTTTHDRHILTNFHYIESGKGFSVIDNKGVQENAMGKIEATFKDVLFLPSTQLNVKQSHSQLIDWMKDIYLRKKGRQALYAFEVGDNFNNRLLMDYE